MRHFNSLPFLRILIPFVAGIALALAVDPSFTAWPALPPLFVMAVLLRDFRVRDKKRYAFFIAVEIFLFLLGVSLVQLSDYSRRPEFVGRMIRPHQETVLVAWPSELPVKKGEWLRCELTLYSAGDTVRKRVKGRILAYFPATIDMSLLVPGNMLLLRTRLVPAPAPLNPGEFDYASWLADRNIFHTSFLKHGEVKNAGIPEQINPIWKLGLNCRSAVLRQLRDSGVSQLTYAICAALLTGQDDDVDRDTITAFAHSGTLHVLSVSGLHVGLVYLALSFMFRIFERSHKRKLARLVFVVTGLWCFALFTGFAAPVLRAVIMFSLVGFGAVYFRNTTRNQLNILFVSAFLVLFWNPFFLVDVGFQLSYTAMIGLICITPWLSALWAPRYYASDLAWKSLCASTAATVTTLPLTLYYFKQFPLWFFLCNLVVVPASSFLLFLSFLLACGLSFLASVTDLSVGLLITFIRWFNSPWLGYVDYIDFDLADLLFCSVLLVLLAATIIVRSHRLALASVLLLLCWQSYSIAASWAKKRSEMLTVYQVSRNSAIAVKRKKTVHLVMSDTSKYDFHVKPSIVRANRPEIRHIPYNMVRSRGLSVLLIDMPLEAAPPESRNTDVLVLSRRAGLRGNVRSDWPVLQMVVCDGSVPSGTKKEIADLCSNFGIRFHNTSELGAWRLPLGNETPDW